MEEHNYLIHFFKGGAKKGSKWKDHKYIARIPVGKNSFRYFYTMDEWKAYKNGLTSNVTYKKNNNAPLTSIINKPTSISTDVSQKTNNIEVTENVEDVEDNEYTELNIADLLLQLSTKKIREELNKNDIPVTSKELLLIGPVGAYLKNKFNNTSTETNFDRERWLELYPSEKNTNIELSDKLPKLTRKYSNTEHQKEINPNFDPYFYWGPYNENCGYCTLAYDFRKRGYDVEAIPNEEGTNPSIYETWYDDPIDFKPSTDYSKDFIYYNYNNENYNYSEYSIQDYEEASKDYGVSYESLMTITLMTDKDVMNATTDEEESEAITNACVKLSEDYSNYLEKRMLEEFPDGARGNFYVAWIQGGGHSMAWEKVGDKIVIYDCQANETRSLQEVFPYIYEYEYYRSDNLTLSEIAYDKVKPKRR